MKKILSISFITLFFLSCGIKKEKAKFYYPKKSSFVDNSNLSRVYLDSIKNYEELIRILNEISCSNQTPVLKFNNKKSEFRLVVFKDCSESNNSPLYWNRNVINIQNDSIIIDNNFKVHFKNLTTVLKKHLINPNNENNFSANNKKSVIFYYQDGMFEMEKVKEQLLKIITEFNKINKKVENELNLKIKMSDKPYQSIKTPPLPKN